MNKTSKIPPVGLHPDVISRHHACDPTTGEQVPDDLLQAIVDAAAFGHETGKRMVAAHDAIMANEMATPIANEKRAREASWKLCESVLKRIDATTTRANAERNAILERIVAPPKPNDLASTMIASEIRSALAAMSATNRRKAIDEAIATDEDEVVSAILHAPPLSTGLSKAHKDALRATWQRMRFPAEIDRARRLKAAMDDIERAGSALITFTNSLTNVKRIEIALESERRALDAG